jgi:hypothetical protein
MMSILRPQLAAIAFLLLAPAGAFAQNIGARYIESIDVRVLNAENVVIGKLVTVMSRSGRAVAVVAVEETLKGEHQEFRQVDLRALGDTNDIRRVYKEDKMARLLFYDSSFAVLDNRGPKYGLLGGVAISGADEVVPYLRELIRSHPEWRKGQQGQQTFPVDGLIVPIDARLEKWAIEAVGNSGDDNRRHTGVQALQFFKSDANIVLMRRLLADPAGRIVSGRRHYYIRQRAYEALNKWDVPVDAPLLNEDLPKQ